MEDHGSSVALDNARDAKLDTSGRVECASSFQPIGWAIWPDLDPFTQGYIEALFASLIEEWRHQVGFKAGDKVRVHTDEVGTVTGRKTGKTKSVHVLFRPGFGGEYFPFECVPVAPGFSDLAPETLARIIADCAAFERHYPMRPFAEYRRARGASFWKQRAPGHRTSDFAPIYFPPLTPTLGDDGRVYLREVA